MNRWRHFRQRLPSTTEPSARYQSRSKHHRCPRSDARLRGAHRAAQPRWGESASPTREVSRPLEVRVARRGIDPTIPNRPHVRPHPSLSFCPSAPTHPQSCAGPRTRSLSTREYGTLRRCPEPEVHEVVAREPREPERATERSERNDPRIAACSVLKPPTAYPLVVA